MTTCINGHQNAPDAKVCDQCGTPLLPPGNEAYSAMADETVTCPGCGLMNETDAIFCDQCGSPIGGGDMDVMGGQTNSAHPRDNLVRARQDIGLRAEGDGTEPNVLFGHFSQFNTWYRVDSLWEGTFMERVLPGAFTDTIKKDRATMRVLYDHGMDMFINNKPLGPIRTLKEDAEGPYYEVPLLDTDYNRDFVIPALRGQLMDGTTVGSQLGSSFRFQVLADEWNHKPKASRANPEALPERSITSTKVFEFGPVTFPANPAATASARSVTDRWMGKLVGDPQFLAEFSERVGTRVAARILDGVPDDRRAALLRTEPDAARVEWMKRRARALLAVG